MSACRGGAYCGSLPHSLVVQELQQYAISHAVPYLQVDKKVLALEVAVSDAPLVTVFDAVAHLPEPRCSLFLRNALLALQQV